LHARRRPAADLAAGSVDAAAGHGRRGRRDARTGALRDIDYYYRSRLAGEPVAGVEDIHFHPVEPRRIRITLSAAF
jgi:hypothetical protein